VLAVADHHMAREVTISGGWAAAAVLAALVVGGTVGAFVTGPVQAPTNANDPDDGETTGRPLTDASVSTFDSEAAFREYLQRADRRSSGRSVAQSAAGGDEASAPRDADASRETDAEPAGTPASTAAAGSGDGGSAPRTSGTNVQVAGIDEPDRLKTAPETLFYADRSRRAGSTHLLNVSDPAAPDVAAELPVSGRLLLVGDVLVVFQHDRLLGYDVTNRSDPERVWTKDLTGQVVTARLYAGHVYLVTAERIDREQPCPVEPVEGAEVACTDVHHPSSPVAVDRTYSVTVLNPDGTVDDTTGFVGTSRQSAVYMSENGVYLTYTKRVSRADLMLAFFTENQSHRFDEATLARFEEIRSYDLSDRAKRYEVMATVRDWMRGLNETRRDRVRRQLSEDMDAWTEAHKREFQRTGIVEFAVRNPDSDSPSVETADVGTVPGRPLDQFSLDEHEGHLRIATTVDGVMGAESANDVYVLDGSLDVAGSVQDMGVTERIYSVRFRGDEAYVVTFRRIDPFHVLDLSNPRDPTLEGELKLPGFSSYLHPLGPDRVLGIGEEDGAVKLVVFDVSDPTDPTIEESRVLDTRWSAVAESHHAFLHDSKHGVFFLPTADAGYVYSYEDGLDRVASVEVGGEARRAAYVGDHLYVFGEGEVIVVDETTWNRTDTLPLS